MADYSQLNYDELREIAKKFHDEGEDCAQLYSSTKQKVQALTKEWVGESADKFFDEMENEVLPALNRLALALIYSKDVLNKIMKLYREGEEDTAGYFKADLNRDDFGAGIFGSALGGVQGELPGADDFGAGQFQRAGVGSSEQLSPASGDFGAGQLGQSESGGETVGGAVGEGSQQSDGLSGSEAAGSSGSSAGSGSGSQGLQGNLGGMGAGLGGSSSGAEGRVPGMPEQVMPDHIYQSGSALGSTEGDIPQTSSDSGGEQSGANGIAAGAAGVAGIAAAGSAAKVLSDKKDD